MYQLHKLGKVYDKAVEEYKNFTLKQLRVPLLIYTESVQIRLFVYLSPLYSCLFAANNLYQLSILQLSQHLLSSLSGFVLAFLFAMNKQYIKASSDDIGFILIDDPYLCLLPNTTIKLSLPVTKVLQHSTSH